MKKVLLIIPKPKIHRTSEEHLGVQYIDSVLTSYGYNVQIIDAWLENLSNNYVIEKINSLQESYLIGFSLYQINLKEALHIISNIKSKHKHIIFAGGFGPTFNPSEFLKTKKFDFVVRGEVENIIVKICNTISKSINSNSFFNLPNISYIKNDKIYHNPMIEPEQDLDNIPFPTRKNIKLTINKKIPTHILTSRGCTSNCRFCSVIAFDRLSKGKYWRSRSIQNIIEEIEYLYYTYNIRNFKVIDDSFIENERDAKWCSHFADLLEEKKINALFRGSIKANKVTDSLVKQLKRIGFFSFSCGIENFSETALKRMNKSAKLKHNINALEIFKKYNMYIQAGQILFDYETTIEEIVENYKYMIKYDWIISKGIFTEMYAAEGTRYTENLKKNNILNKSDTMNYNYFLKHKEVEVIYNAMKSWHKSNLKLYNMAIDPISSPKVMTERGYSLFHLEYKKIRMQDLKFMKNILELSLNNKFNNIKKITEKYIADSNLFYKKMFKKINKLYKNYGLEYDADEDPFL